MKKIFIISSILIAFLFLAFISHIFDEKKAARNIEYINNERTIVVLDGNEKQIFNYSIDDFKNWADKNWNHLFQEPPSFGELRRVDIENFHRFDKSATISPDQSRLAFSVHDYAAASHISFVGIIDIETKEINLIKDFFQGNIEKIIWSEEGRYLAYPLNTARAAGEYLVVSNAEKLNKEFIISSIDLLDYLKLRYLPLRPSFRNLAWENERLYFETNKPAEGVVIRWSIKKDGSSLRTEKE